MKALDQKGAGIILVLLVCSLVGAATLYLMDMNKVSEKKIVNDARVQSYQSLVKIVTNKIHAGNNCTAALGGTNITPAFNPLGMSIELPLNLEINNKILKKPNGKDVWFLQGGTSIKDVILVVNERVRTPVRLEPAGSQIWVAAKGYILIIPGHPGVGIKLARNKHYKIPIFLHYTVSGTTKTLRNCSDPNSGALICTITGGAYDHAGTIEDRKCNPDRTCFAYNVNGTGVGSGSGPCPPPYTVTKVGHFGSDLYMCEWCNKNSVLPQPTYPSGYFFDPLYPDTRPVGSVLVNPNQVIGP